MANEDTMLRTHCCGHKCFPVYPCAQHLLRTQNLCPRHKNVSDLFQKHFVSATNVSRFAQHRNNHEQHCVLVCHHLLNQSFEIYFILDNLLIQVWKRYSTGHRFVAQWSCRFHIITIRYYRVKTMRHDIYI